MINWVYDFPSKFSGIIVVLGGYGLQHLSSHYVPASCYFEYGHLETGLAKPNGGCAEMVWKLCIAGVVALQSLQILH